jgi:hypothetical protein
MSIYDLIEQWLDSADVSFENKDLILYSCTIQTSEIHIRCKKDILLYIDVNKDAILEKSKTRWEKVKTLRVFCDEIPLKPNWISFCNYWCYYGEVAFIVFLDLCKDDPFLKTDSRAIRLILNTSICILDIFNAIVKQADMFPYELIELCDGEQVLDLSKQVFEHRFGSHQGMTIVLKARAVHQQLLSPLM